MIKCLYKPKIRRKKKFHNFAFSFTYGKRKVFFVLFCIISIVLIVYFLIDTKVEPIIKKSAGSEIVNQLTTVMNGSVYEVLRKNGVSYGKLVSVNTNNEGSVTSITADSYYINKLKTEIEMSLKKNFAKNREKVLSVSLGDIVGGQLLNNRGLSFKIRTSVHSFTVTDFLSEFSSVGVNQTHHKIYIKIKVCSLSYVGGLKIEKTASTKVLVAETVIVGVVPDSYRYNS